MIRAALATLTALSLLAAACSGNGPTLSEVAEDASTTTSRADGRPAPRALEGEDRTLPDPCLLLSTGDVSGAIGLGIDMASRQPPIPLGVPGTTRSHPARSCAFTQREDRTFPVVSVRVSRPGENVDDLLSLVADHGEVIEVPGSETSVLHNIANAVWGLDGDLLVVIQASYQGGTPLEAALPELLERAVENA